MRLSNVPNELRKYVEEPERYLVELAVDAVLNSPPSPNLRAILLPKFYDLAANGTWVADGDRLLFEYDYEGCIQLSLDAVSGLTRDFAETELLVAMKAFDDYAAPRFV
jgi:hypothetical protein